MDDCPPPPPTCLGQVIPLIVFSYTNVNKLTDTAIIEARANASGPSSRSLDNHLWLLLLYHHSCIGVTTLHMHGLLLHGLRHRLLHLWVMHEGLLLHGRGLSHARLAIRRWAQLLSRLWKTTFVFVVTRFRHRVIHLEFF